MNTDSEPLYDYLNPNIQEIRLLTVLRPSQYDYDSDDEVPHLSMRSRILACCANKFHALSYTWGTDVPSHEVVINDHRVLVSKNVFLLLEEFLSTALKNDECQELWIDSICINQSDIEERNQQVRWMGDIYSVAKSTLIWLDDLSINRRVAPTIVRKFKEADRSFKTLWETVDAVEDFDDPSPSLKEMMEEVWNIFSHPYWKRLWIVQEVVLAREAKLILHGGRTCLDGWAGVLPLEDQYYQALSAEDKLLFSKSHANLRQLRLLSHYRDSPKARSLSGLLKSCGEHGCMNPKDMVYGLLGLADDGDQLPVDYRKTNTELVFDALEVMYPAEDVSQQVESLDKLLQALQVPLGDLLDHVIDAEGEHRTRLLARIYPLNLEIEAFELPTYSYSDDDPRLHAVLLNARTSDRSLQEHLLFSQNRGEDRQFVCLACPPLSQSLSRGNDDPITTTKTTATVYCSAWELLLFFSLSNSRNGVALSIARDFASTYVRRATNIEQLNELMIDCFKLEASVDNSNRELSVAPKAKPEQVSPSIEEEHPPQIADQLAALALESDISRSERLRKRTEYWREIRVSRMIDDMHSSSWKQRP